MSDVTILDSTGATKTVRTITRGGKEYCVVEPPAVNSYPNLDLDENGVAVLASAGQVQDVEIFNRHTGPLYVKLYNKATTPNQTDTPLRTWEVMPGNPPFVRSWINGINCPLGIGLRCTTGFAAADVGAPPANTCIINLGYRAGE